ncbi:hypothetical protein [Lentzea sp. NPDC003310]|uniref:hypothetical protein n=1 Tax=Lentzea sp. NPDC003310 TaxID=3154447 RepID=UPI0033B687C7
MFPAPPPSTPAAQRGTPFLHCVAGASIWFFAAVTVQVIVGLRTGYGLDGLGSGVAGDVVVWMLTSFVTWLIASRVRIKPWVLIFLSLPVYVLLTILITIVLVVVGVGFQLVFR